MLTVLESEVETPSNSTLRMLMLHVILATMHQTT